jgi:L1 cell adhesion molecule like protein
LIPNQVQLELGTTNSCLGVYHNNKVEIVLNELGNPTTPSVVAFTDDKFFVGEEAKK